MMVEFLLPKQKNEGNSTTQKLPFLMVFFKKQTIYSGNKIVGFIPYQNLNQLRSAPLPIYCAQESGEGGKRENWTLCCFDRGV